MKVLIVTPYYIPYVSGMTVYERRLAEGLVNAGHSVSVLTSKHEKGLRGREKINGVEIIRKPVLFKMQRGSFAPGILLALLRVSKDYDVVNIHAPFFEAGFLSGMAKAARKKVFLTYHCDLSMRNGLFSKTIESVYYLSVKAAAKDSAKIIVNSMDYLENSRLRAYKGKGIGVFPPIDTQEFKENPERDEFKRRFSIGRDDKVVGFVGRLTYEKGLTYLIEAVPKIREKIPNLKVFIAGESPNVAGGAKESVKKDIESLIEKNHLEEIVLFTGYLSDEYLVKFYSSCDVFALPSIDPLESFGMVQVEAMLCGCPVVASDMPGMRDPVNLTGFGALATPRDVGSLADAVVRVLENGGRFYVGRDKVTDFFGTDKTVKRYEEVFKHDFIPEKTK